MISKWTSGVVQKNSGKRSFQEERPAGVLLLAGVCEIIHSGLGEGAGSPVILPVGSPLCPQLLASQHQSLPSELFSAMSPPFLTSGYLFLVGGDD